MSIKRFKECRMCGKQEPRGWTEADLFKCEECKADTRAELRTLIAPRSMANKSHASKVAQSQAAKAAQHRDPRAAQLARAMANDPRPAARGTQQDPTSDPMHILNPLNPLSPISPLNPLNDWDDSPHRHVSASSVSSCDDSSSSYHHNSHDSSSSYDSGSDSSSYSSGGCD